MARHLLRQSHPPAEKSLARVLERENLLDRRPLLQILQIERQTLPVARKLQIDHYESQGEEILKKP